MSRLRVGVRIAALGQNRQDAVDGDARHEGVVDEEALEVGDPDANALEAGESGTAAADAVADFQAVGAADGAVDGQRAAEVFDGERWPVVEGDVGQAQRPGRFEAKTDLERAIRPERGDGAAFVVDLAADAQPPHRDRNAHGEEQPFAAEPE